MPSTITTTGHRRKKSGATRKDERGMPGWVWMLLGMALGLVIAVLIYLLQHTSPEQTHDPESTTSVSTEAEADEPEATDTPEEAAVTEPVQAPEQERRRFDFYNLLPDMEVVIPEREQPATPGGSPPPETTLEPEPGTRYIMQAGSFQSFADADRMKANLALLGVESHIEQVTIDDGSRWHRVRIGPIDDFEQMVSTRERLADNDIEVMLIRVRE